MPPTGGIRTSMSWQATYPLGQAVTNAMFSPGQPLTPPDQEPVRVWDFPVGVNANITPRSSEAFGFAHLRAFANVELVRLAIETRKDQLEALHWRFTPRTGISETPALQARAARLTQFWRRPDGVHAFATWLRLALEDLLAIDAPAFEKRRDRAGRLIGLDVVPGDTLKLLVDETGRTPAPPSPAYQQIIKGRVWADLTTDDLLYAPRNRRPNHLLGFSPVEQIVVTLQTVINRQAAQLAYFTEGNAPQGFLTAPEGWGPSQIRELQLWLNTQLSGQPSERAKLIWIPSGATYQALKDPPLKDDFDEWLARIVAFAFSLPPTPYVRQMNRATAGEDQDRSLEEGLAPLKLWVKRLIEGVNEDEFGETDLDFAWLDSVQIDQAAQSQMDDRDLRNGSLSVNEVRFRRGLGPVEGGDTPRIYGPAEPLNAPPAAAPATH
ncbi:MAG TPA: phage portal protein [Caulobacteraceae bacterium]|nr:phage portal protein [Caulobacteraceae bacterium]